MKMEKTFDQQCQEKETVMMMEVEKVKEKEECVQVLASRGSLREEDRWCRGDQEL